MFKNELVSVEVPLGKKIVKKQTKNGLKISFVDDESIKVTTPSVTANITPTKDWTDFVVKKFGKTPEAMDLLDFIKDVGDHANYSESWFESDNEAKYPDITAPGITLKEMKESDDKDLLIEKLIELSLKDTNNRQYKLTSPKYITIDYLESLGQMFDVSNKKVIEIETDKFINFYFDSICEDVVHVAPEDREKAFDKFYIDKDLVFTFGFSEGNNYLWVNKYVLTKLMKYFKMNEDKMNHFISKKFTSHYRFKSLLSEGDEVIIKALLNEKVQEYHDLFKSNPIIYNETNNIIKTNIVLDEKEANKPISFDNEKFYMNEDSMFVYRDEYKLEILNELWKTKKHESKFYSVNNLDLFINKYGNYPNLFIVSNKIFRYNKKAHMIDNSSKLVDVINALENGKKVFFFDFIIHDKLDCKIIE